MARPTGDDRTGSMSLEALECRADGGRHRWQRFSEAAGQAARAAIRRNVASIMVVRVCSTCGTERHDEYAWPDLELVSRKMVYPRDENGQNVYLLRPEDQGTGRVRAASAKGSLILRVLNGAVT